MRGICMASLSLVLGVLVSRYCDDDKANTRDFLDWTTTESCDIDAQTGGIVAMVEVQSAPRDGLRHVAGGSASLLTTHIDVVAVHTAVQTTLALALFRDGCVAPAGSITACTCLCRLELDAGRSEVEEDDCWRSSDRMDSPNWCWSLSA